MVDPAICCRTQVDVTCNSRHLQISASTLSLLPTLAPLLHFHFTAAAVFRQSALRTNTQTHSQRPHRKRTRDGLPTHGPTFPAPTITPPVPVLLLGADTAGESNGTHCPTTSDHSEGTITTPKKVYRPPLTSMYQPPKIGPDLLDGTDWLFREHGQAIIETTRPLPPRDDMIFFDPGNDQAELDRNLQPQHCPLHLQAKIIDTVKEFWDAFCERGLQRPIRGFSFQIDTGTSPPICCSTP